MTQVQADLRMYVRQNNLSRVKEINPKFYTDSLLLIACQYSNREMVEYLLDYCPIKEMHLDYLFVFREGNKTSIGEALIEKVSPELLEEFLQKAKFYGEIELEKMILTKR